MILLIVRYYFARARLALETRRLARARRAVHRAIARTGGPLLDGFPGSTQYARKMYLLPISGSESACITHDMVSLEDGAPVPREPVVAAHCRAVMAVLYAESAVKNAQLRITSAL